MNNALKEMYKFINTNSTKICDYLSEQSIEWSFIPPQSPHMGGLWESAVKACKKPSNEDSRFSFTDFWRIDHFSRSNRGDTQFEALNAIIYGPW